MVPVNRPGPMSRPNRYEVTLRTHPKRILPLLAASAIALGTNGAMAQSNDVPLRAMIGQMLMVGFGGTGTNEAWVKTVRGQVASGKVGGVFFMGRNIKGKGQVKKLTRYFLTANPKMPPFIAVDQEGGRVQRLKASQGFTSTESAQALARRNDVGAASRAYGRLAAQLRDTGFNLNFGPVVDVDVNPRNPVIAVHKRSYGSNPKTVETYAKAFIKSHHRSGVLTVLKHFPGHGSSTKDSHNGLVDISTTWKSLELAPYSGLIKSNSVDMVMVGHLYHKALSDRGTTPATLSKKAVNGKLRGELNYGGVVITDDLEMAAVRKLYKKQDAIIRAIRAGNDILLFSQTAAPTRHNFPDTFIKTVEAAVKRGAISRKRIAASYNRIVRLKRRLRAQ